MNIPKSTNPTKARRAMKRNPVNAACWDTMPITLTINKVRNVRSNGIKCSMNACRAVSCISLLLSVISQTIKGKMNGANMMDKYDNALTILFFDILTPYLILSMTCKLEIGKGQRRTFRQSNL